MSKKDEKFINSIFSRVTVVYFIIITLLLIFICITDQDLIIPSLIIAILLCIYSFWTTRKMSKIKRQKSEELTGTLDNITKQTLKDIIIPIVIINSNCNIIYENTSFKNMLTNQDKTKYMTDIIKEISQDEESQYINKDFKIEEKTYNIIGNITKKDNMSVYMLYFLEKTQYLLLEEKYNDSKDTVGIIMLDNYDEIIQNVSTEHRPQLVAKIEKTLYDWSTPTGGVIIKMEKDRFVYIFSRKNIKEFEDNKFNILDKIRQIDTESRIPLTLSVGISLVGESYYELYKSANSALDIALGRGGDQVVIKKDGKYDFFGGRTQEVEKRTKVKARIVAHALNELIEESKSIIIMGHVNSDIDSIGSALGIYRLAKNQNKEAYIVLNSYGPTLEKFMESVNKEETYKDVFIGKNEAIAKVTSDTLLIIVDTNRKSYVEAPELLEETDRIVLIDHHRRGADFIEPTLLKFHEVYASSASELVTEIISYSNNEVSLEQLEAEALYSGIMIDTKNFTFKTGVRTFEAAAYLKKSGIDIIKIKQWFETDLSTYNTIAEIVKSAQIIQDKIAIAIYNTGGTSSQLIAAKSADEILTISGITASFVLYIYGQQIGISGRSIGDINVQLILEKLGGGGHITFAGAQLSNVTMEEAKEKLILAIKEYFDEGTN